MYSSHKISGFLYINCLHSVAVSYVFDMRRSASAIEGQRSLRSTTHHKSPPPTKRNIPKWSHRPCFFYRHGVSARVSIVLRPVAFKRARCQR